MDEDRIGLVLAKTSELRSKIVNCIHKAASNVDKEEKLIESEAGDDNNEEEEESLLNIKEALESLEAQLSSLQALQQEQWYEKESALAEIQYSQKKLIKNLNEYKGKDLEIIHEAIAFAGDTEDNNDLLLPPYPQPLLSENGYRHSFQSTQKSQNGFIKDIQESDRNERQSGLWGPFKRLKGLLGVFAKTAVTIVGVMAILSLAGLEPRLKKRDNQFKLFDLMKIEKNDERDTIDCPPGKIPLVENGEIRCVVKERVETPFEPVIATPDVNYGCG